MTSVAGFRSVPPKAMCKVSAKADLSRRSDMQSEREGGWIANHGRGACIAVGDPLGALKRVALRDDASALALRGSRWRNSAIWYGEGSPSKGCVPSVRKTVARARYVVAEAEIALVSAT